LCVELNGLLGKVKRIYGRLRERRKAKAVLIPAWKSSFGELPPISFEALLKIYLRDPAARAAVDFLADQTVGVGFYTTARLSKAKQLIDEFNESVNLDGLLLRTAREIIAFGNCFWEKIEPEKIEFLQILPITSMEKIQRDEYGVVRGYKQTLRYGGNTLPPNRIIHFRWNPLDGEAFGTGILRTLAETMPLDNGEQRPSLAVIKATVEKCMVDIFQKYAGPTEVWKFPGLSEEKAAEYASMLKSMPREGARLVVNMPAEVQTVSVDPRSRFEAYIQHLWNQYTLGLQTPLPKLFTTPGFTEASARAAVEVAERKIGALQRFIKRIIEHEVFVPVLLQAGIDPKEAECRLNWGAPQKPSFQIADALKAYEIGVISVDELRKMLVEAGWILTKRTGGEKVGI